MDLDILRKAGRELYHTDRLKGMKRYLVYRARCRMNQDVMKGVTDFFKETPLRREMVEGTPAFVEQVTRSFFYKDSGFEDRAKLVKDHVLFMEKNFTPDALRRLYASRVGGKLVGEKLCLWQEEYEGEPLSMYLSFSAGQRKEGCLALVLALGEEELYQIMFWFSPDMEGEKDAVWIGALQGTPNGSDIIKALTKAFFGYRTKNLVFYGIRNLARCLGLEKIYAVTNEGYYAMNHVRSDRKLKTDFGEFWAECEGKLCEKDPRFFVMPVSEHRKDMSELKPSKRAQHRRRFARLDAIDAAFDENMEKYLLPGRLHKKETPAAES